MSFSHSGGVCRHALSLFSFLSIYVLYFPASASQMNQQFYTNIPNHCLQHVKQPSLSPKSMSKDPDHGPQTNGPSMVSAYSARSPSNTLKRTPCMSLAPANLGRTRRHLIQLETEESR